MDLIKQHFGNNALAQLVEVTLKNVRLDEALVAVSTAPIFIPQDLKNDPRLAELVSVAIGTGDKSVEPDETDNAHGKIITRKRYPFRLILDLLLEGAGLDFRVEPRGITIVDVARDGV
jgi:hypothetical protein